MLFKDYYDTVSLIYYGSMAVLILFVSHLPSKSLNIFDFKLLKSAINAFWSQNVLMSAPQPQGGGGAQPADVAQPAGVAQLARPPQPAFFRQPAAGVYNIYTVTDPSGSGNNGYINPQKGRPWHLDNNNNTIAGFTYGQLPRNLSTAMHAHATENGHSIRSWSGIDFDVNSARFYHKWQRYHNPLRDFNNYNNSAPIREAFNRLP